MIDLLLDTGTVLNIVPEDRRDKVDQTITGGEMANVYFDEAMKVKPEAAWEALLKVVLKGDS